MYTNISRSIATAILAVGLLVSGFTASAALVSMSPSEQVVADNASFYVDIVATGLPDGTVGGALDISWAAGDMTLDSVYMATTDPADSGGGLFPGPWDPISSFFTGTGTIGAGTLTATFVGSFASVSGDQPIARLNFILAAGVSNSVISVAEAAVGGTWSSWITGDFTNDYAGAIINPIKPIPVPAALWLFGSGFIGLAGIARRRRVSMQTGFSP